MSDILPELEPDEPDDEQGQATTELQVEDTPFTRVPWVSGSFSRRYALSQALSLHNEIEMFGEATDDELESQTEVFDLPGDPVIESNIAYWRYVAPTLATSPNVEWVGHHGYDDSKGYPSFHELKEIAATELPDSAVEEYASVTARIVEKIGKQHKKGNGRRVCCWGLAPRNYDPSGKFKRAYQRFAPLMPQIRPANDPTEPDWVWVKSD